MLSRTLFAALGAFLVQGCSSTAADPPPSTHDAGGDPLCPAGPVGPTKPASMLPSGYCGGNDGPCNYQATPCPDVTNGQMNGYLCTCVNGAWSCQITVQSGGLCAALPDAGPVGSQDAGQGPTGPTGATGPAQP